MRSDDYRCRDCGHTLTLDTDHFKSGDLGPVADIDHEKCLNTRLDRVYSPVAIGGGGPGGSPARRSL